MKYCIVPTTKECYEEVDAESAEAALEKFADNMDGDMGTYFKAVLKEPEISNQALSPDEDKDEDEDEDNELLCERICINGISSGKFKKKVAKKVEKALDKRGIDYDYDDGNRLMVSTKDLEKVEKILFKLDCTYSSI